MSRGTTFPLMRQVVRFPTALLLIPSLFVLLFVVGAQGGEEAWPFFAGRAPQNALQAEAIAQLIIHGSTLLAALAGCFASASIIAVQRDSYAWNLPGLPWAFRIDLLILTAIVMVLAMLWSWRWAPTAMILLAVSFVPFWTGVFVAVGHYGTMLNRPLLGLGIVMGALALAAVRPVQLTTLVRLLDLPGGIVLCVLGVVLMWWATSRSTHRQIVATTPASVDAILGHATEQLASVNQSASPSLWGRMMHLYQEEPRWGWERRMHLPKVVSYNVFNSAFLAVLTFMSGVEMSYLLGMGAANRGLVTVHALLYPLSRSQRATLQFIDHVVSQLVTALTCTVVLWGLSLSRGTNAIETLDGAGVPASVLLAATFALLPLVQFVRAYADVASIPEALNNRAFRKLLLIMSPIIVFGLAAKLGARMVWRVSGEDQLVAMAWCLLLALSLQLLAYLHLRFVFARRDFVPA